MREFSAEFPALHARSLRRPRRLNDRAQGVHFLGISLSAAHGGEELKRLVDAMHRAEQVSA